MQLENIILSSILVKSPLDQFMIKNFLSLKGDLLGSLHLSLTNMGFYLIIATAMIFILHLAATNLSLSVPNS